MNKRILCLCLVLIALMGISGVSACYADNCTVEMSGSEIGWVDPESVDCVEVSGGEIAWVHPESADNSFEIERNQTLAVKDNIGFESGRVSHSKEKIVEDNLTCLPNEGYNHSDNLNLSEMDMEDNEHIFKELVDALKNNNITFTPMIHDKNVSGIDYDPATGILKVNHTKSTERVLKEGDFIFNAAADVPIKNNSTFIPKIRDKNLFALDFDPATGILKVNDDCPYMNSDYINSSDLKWYVSVYNNDYLNKSYRGYTYGSEIGDGYPTRFSKEFNLTKFITDSYLPSDFTNGFYTCKITVDVLGAKDFSIDFAFPVIIDEFNNVKYCPLQKSMAHISGKNIKIYDGYDPMLSIFGVLNYKNTINNILKEQQKASKVSK